MHRFATTPWSLLQQLDDSSQTQRTEAYNRLADTYWSAVYAYLRSHGQPHDQAEENTQAFFVHIIVSRDLFSRTDRSRGRLRNLLLTALRNFLVDQYRRTPVRTQPTGGTNRGPHNDGAHPSNTKTPSDAELAFDQAWTAATMSAALRQCETHFIDSGKPRHWECFRVRVLLPSMYQVEPEPYPQVASRLGFRTPADAAAAVQVVKKHLKVLFHEAVAATVENRSDTVDELAFLERHFSAHSPPGGIDTSR